MQFPFLSPEWLDAARDLHKRYESRLKPTASNVRINQVITGTPYGENGNVLAHIDTESGSLDLGHLESPDATITMDYETAREILLSNDPQVMMRALLMGKLKSDGDASAVMSLQTQFPQDDDSRAVAEAIIAELRAMTA